MSASDVAKQPVCAGAAMRMGDALHLCTRSVGHNPVRAALTTLGIAIGVGAIMAVFALGGAGYGQVEKELLQFGVDRIWITASQVQLMREDADIVSAMYPNAAVVSLCYRTGEVSTRWGKVRANLVGCGGDLQEVQEFTLAQGRFLRLQDDERERAVGVIDETLADALFPSGMAVGKEIILSGHTLTVVGVSTVSEKSSKTALGMLYVPLSFLENNFALKGVDEINLRVSPGEDPEEAARLSVNRLSHSHANGGVQARTLYEEKKAASNILRVFLLVMVTIALICMSVGGIGVMNIMLVSVRERKREIGVLKALGAKDGEILGQFLMESLLYAMVGGTIGMLLGWGITMAAAHIVQIYARVYPWHLGLAVAFSACIGVFFGVYPAARAARLSPVEALRV